jgi:glycosyltransferase involved in cell wall biosynthesis
VPEDKVTVIPPGVDSRWWTRLSPRREQPGPVRILFVGGSLERKGGDLLLAAFRKLRAESISAPGQPEIDLHLVTGQRLPPEPGVTVYNQMKPNSPELRDLYHQSDIFCLPTQADCLPMVLSEAGAAGLPVISTDLAGIPEIVHTGQNGLLIQPGCEEELVQALRTLIQQPALRLQMGAEGQKIVRRQFDAPDNAARLVELMVAVAEEGKRR